MCGPDCLAPMGPQRPIIFPAGPTCQRGLLHRLVGVEPGQPGLIGSSQLLVLQGRLFQRAQLSAAEEAAPLRPCHLDQLQAAAGGSSHPAPKGPPQLPLTSWGCALERSAAFGTSQEAGRVTASCLHQRRLCGAEKQEQGPPSSPPAWPWPFLELGK